MMAVVNQLAIFLCLCIVSVSPTTTSGTTTTTTTTITTTTTTPTPPTTTTPPMNTANPTGNPLTSGGGTGATGRPAISNCGLGCKSGLPRQRFNFGSPNFHGMGSGGSTPGVALHGTLQFLAVSLVAIFIHLT